jgi:hypothetical protein
MVFALRDKSMRSAMICFFAITHLAPSRCCHSSETKFFEDGVLGGAHAEAVNAADQPGADATLFAFIALNPSFYGHAMSQAILRRHLSDAMNKDDPNLRCGVLCYGPLLKWVGWVGVTLFLGMSVGFGLTAPPEERIAAAVIFGLFALAGGFLVLEGCWVRIMYDEEGLRTRSPWRRSRCIPWTEVVLCDYADINQWYRIHTRSQGIIRVSLLLHGVAGLLRMLPCEHPSYPPVTASGRSVNGLGTPRVIVPGNPVPVKALAAHVICWSFVALGIGALLLYSQSDLPRPEDYRTVHSKIIEIKTKARDRGRQQFRLTVAGAPAGLLCSVHRDNVQWLTNRLRVGDEITALVSRAQWEKTKKPLFSSEPQIWMVGLKGAGWEFLRFEEHVAHEKREITMSLWGGIGFILFGFGLLWQIKRETRKHNQPTEECPSSAGTK